MCRYFCYTLYLCLCTQWLISPVGWASMFYDCANDYTVYGPAGHYNKWLESESEIWYQDVLIWQYFISHYAVFLSLGYQDGSFPFVTIQALESFFAVFYSEAKQQNLLISNPIRLSYHYHDCSYGTHRDINARYYSHNFQSATVCLFKWSDRMVVDNAS